jgi:hypothetical protein
MAVLTMGEAMTEAMVTAAGKRMAVENFMMRMMEGL